jgi:signal transduction histidine kinase
MPEVYCQPMQINQVLLNILVNASQAIEGEGTIRISLHTYAENSVQIRIKDSGCGIPAEIRDKIFDPFFTTKEVGSGTGLGLSVSYGIVKNHRGTIELTSDVGAGTEFIITLPIDNPDKHDSDEQSSAVKD